MPASRQSCVKAWVRPADVGAGEDLAIEVGLRKLLEGELQHLEVVGGGVGGGVAGPQDGGQRLAALGQVAEQRVKAEAALVVAGGAFLLGVGGEERGVDVEDQLLGPGAGIPCLGHRLGPGGADRFEQAGVDRLHHPVGRRLRGHCPEQSLLAAQHAEVRDAIAAVGDGDGKVAQDDAGVVGGAALAGARHRP